MKRLRPLLSHDKKQITLKITDKTQRFGLKTKNVLLKGYPSVIFCTVGLKIDEQEATRFLLLSPETSQEKIREAIHEKIKKETDTNGYQEWLNNDPERKLLKERIRAIKQENIGEIKISSPQEIEERFLGKGKILKPRDPRDIGRVISLVKCFALLNLWFREKEGSAIIASDDVNEAFRTWDDLPPLIVPLVKLESMESWPQEQVVGSLGHCAALVDCIPCVTPQ